MAGYTLVAEDHQQRLRKIEGQVRGIQRMIEADRYCVDVLVQIGAVRHALDAVAMGLVDDHVRHCVLDVVTSEPALAERRLADALEAVHRLLRA